MFSDGVLIPSELARRAEHLGLAGIGITDHGDSSNIDFVVPRIVGVAIDLNRFMTIKVIPGIELTHVPPPMIAECAKRARNLGARIIIVHGETIAEPVAPGTNRAAIDAGVNILAHPGLISMEEVLMAKEKGILLEITARKGHSLTNGHVAKLAVEAGAKLVINTDTHAPSDLITREQALKIVLGAGLSEADFEMMRQNASAFL
ncbi:MAG: histidinol phosphate phosphatase domain-containing protein [Desulfobacteraceae bacterium]|nr:MAG: histidinol phosphate phosphatase domain-containing protein [Desulfobacteraceae bacterium]